MTTCQRVKRDPTPLRPDEAHQLMRLLALVPADEWADTDRLLLAADADPSLDVAVVSGEVMLGGHSFTTSLRRLRRRGWVVQDRHATPQLWTRTPRGTAQLSAPVAP